MAVELIRIYSVDENDDPLEDVLIKFYSAADVFITQNTTELVEDEAYCEVSLDGDTTPIEYRIRLIKNGVAFDGSLGDSNKTPQLISVYSPPDLSPTDANSFTVQGQTFSRPVSADPRLCRCSGFFKDLLGRPLANLPVHIRGACFNDDQNVFTPTIVDGNLVMQGEPIIGRTDENGYFIVDLYRTGHYSFLLAGLETETRSVYVPDTTSFNLINMLFPVVTSITFDPDPIDISVDESVDVEVEILASDTTTLDVYDDNLTFLIEDTSIATIVLVDGKLQITGCAAGTTQLTVEISDDTIVTIPTEPVTYSPLQITVS
jgi:hypothetical protein